jgi:DNA-binding HxlR family transcriptional regulator
MTIKINNMTQKQQDAIDGIMDYFNFEKVLKVMELLEWEWKDAEEGIPTVPELRQEVRRLLRMAFKEKTDVSTGGFHVRYESDADGGEFIQLMFAVEEWYEDVEKDLVE